MHACQVVAQKGSSAITAVIVGYCAAKLPQAVADRAAKLAKGTLSGAQWVDVDDSRYLLVNRPDESWLVGGEDWRQIGATLVAQVRAAGETTATVLVDAEPIQVQHIAEGCLLGDYQFTACRSGQGGKRKQIKIRIPGASKAVATARHIAEAQNSARTLADMPPNQLYPEAFVAYARKACAGTGLRIKAIQGLEALRKAGFPGLVTVGQGSRREPAMLQISYTPSASKKKAATSSKGKKKASATHLALVGKGITFDSGGISLKPGSGMWEMKFDMGGAAAMFGAIAMIAALKPNIPVTAYFALAENMPDGLATRPGDIYQARNGKWIHVDNTDAEGRLVMSDVLTYACERGATHMVNAATLTGAELVALGTSIAAIMGRHDDWIQDVRTAGQESGEELWPMPLYGEYRKQLDHIHADINNIGGRWAGCITAGIFLSEFVDESVKWAHCDLAGPAMRTDGWRYYAKGGTAFGARSFAQLAMNLR